MGNSHGFHGSHGNPIGMGIAKLILWEWEWLDWNGREWRLHIFPFPVTGREPACQWCYINFSGTHSTVIAHQLRSALSLTLSISATQTTINSKAAMNWQNMSTRMGMGAVGNGNNQWEWEGNGNETRLNLGSGTGMGMNHWELEGMGLKKTFSMQNIRRASDKTSAVWHHEWNRPTRKST